MNDLNGISNKERCKAGEIDTYAKKIGKNAKC